MSCRFGFAEKGDEVPGKVEVRDLPQSSSGSFRLPLVLRVHNEMPVASVLVMGVVCIVSITHWQATRGVLEYFGNVVVIARISDENWRTDVSKTRLVG